METIQCLTIRKISEKINNKKPEIPVFILHLGFENLR